MVASQNIGIVGEVTARAWNKNGRRKLLFQPNKLWEFFVRKYGINLKIPLLFGYWRFTVKYHNDLTNLGKTVIAKRLTGISQNPVDYMAIGTGTPTSTELGAEIVSGGGERVQAAVSVITIDTTEDTAQWQNTYAFTASFLITEEGLFDGGDPGESIMLSSWVMAGLDMDDGDSLQLTHRMKFSQPS